MAENKISLRIVSGLFILSLKLSNVLTHNNDCGLLESNNNNKIIPWMANIYQLNPDGAHEFICSGTVVSQKVVLTSAHCFYDDISKDIKNAVFFLSIGQESTAWTSTKNVQTRKIPQDSIIIPKQYKGILDNYSYNIAIIKLDTDQEFVLGGASKKACVYWDNDFSDTQLEINFPALKVAVWGADSRFTIIEPLYINEDQCLYEVSKDFQPFLTFDKMCMQVPSLPSLSSIGSGLYVLNKDTNRWYLIGIASDVTSYNSKKYITFIKMQPHLNWISNNAFLEVR